MVGAQKFAAVSIRPAEAKSNLEIFGGMGVALFGDIAQLRPIGQKTLLAPMSSGGSRISDKLSNSGGRILDTFNECARLRVIYRQGEPCPFKESTRRLCDPALTIADCELRKSRDIATSEWPEELNFRADSFLWLCEENATPCGRVGPEIAAFSKSGRAPLLRYEAVRNTPDGANYRRGELRCLRSKCNMARVAPLSSLRIRSTA